MVSFPTRVLLATDGSPSAELAARSAVDLAAKTGSELHVVHIGEYLPTFYAFTDEEPAELRGNARRLLDAEAAKVEAMGGRVTAAHLRLGHPAEQIIALAEEIGAGVIAVGSRGHGALRRAVLGSVSEAVVRYAPCPVFVVREEPARERA